MAKQILHHSLWLVLIAAIIFAGFFAYQTKAQSCDVKIDWYNMADPNNWVFQYQTCHPASEVPPCQPGYSRVGNVSTGDNFCVYSGLPVEPPNYPGINAGAACLAGAERTVTIIPTGDEHELQRSPGNQILNLTGNSYTYFDMQEGIDYRFRAQATNAGGSSGWSDWTGIVRHDLSAPVTSLDLVGLAGNNGWWRSNVSATLPATDTGCLGVSQTNYTLDGLSSSYTASPIMITGNGAHSLSYYSTDGIHDEVSQNATIQIDTVVPDLRISPDRLPDGQNGWWLGPVSFTVSGIDATSGVASLEYDLDGAGWQTYTNIITISNNGNHTFDGRVVDFAGWETINGLNVPIDASQPNLRFVAERAPDRNGWYNHSVHFGIEYSDGTSGVAATIARLNAGQWQAYQAAYLIGGDGEHVFEAAVTDNAGNAIARQTIVKIDITPPVTTLDYDGTAIDFTVTDNRSGFLGITLSINGVVTSYMGNPISLGDAGDYVIEFYSTDMAGNSEATQVLHLHHNPNVGTISPISLTPPVLQAELTCSAPTYQISGFASATAGLNEVYLIVQPENSAEIILRGDNSYVYSPASTTVESIAFTYQAQSEASHDFILVALDVSGNERRLKLSCVIGTSFVSAPPIQETIVDDSDTTESTNLDSTTTNAGNPEENPSETEAQSTEGILNSGNNNAESESSETLYIPYEPPTTTIELAPQTSMELTYVTESSSSGLDALEIAEILAAIGLLTTTVAGVVISQSESAKQKQEELNEKLDDEVEVLNTAFNEQIANAQENALVNAVMQATKDNEVILAVAQSEANKAYHEYIAALWDNYNRDMETFQHWEVVREVNSQIDPMVDDMTEAMVALDAFITKDEEEELQKNIDLLKEAQAKGDIEAILEQSAKLNESFVVVQENAKKRIEYYQQQQQADSMPPAEVPAASDIGYAPTQQTFAPAIANIMTNVFNMTNTVAELTGGTVVDIDAWIEEYKAKGWDSYLETNYGIYLTFNGSNVENYDGSEGWTLQSIYAVNLSAEATASNLNTLYDENSAGLPPLVLANIAEIEGDLAQGQQLFKDLIGPITVNLVTGTPVPNLTDFQLQLVTQYGQAFYENEYVQEQLALHNYQIEPQKFGEQFCYWVYPDEDAENAANEAAIEAGIIPFSQAFDMNQLLLGNLIYDDLQVNPENLAIVINGGNVPVLDENNQPVIGDDGQPVFEPVLGLTQTGQSELLISVGLDLAALAASNEETPTDGIPTGDLAIYEQALLNAYGFQIVYPTAANPYNIVLPPPDGDENTENDIGWDDVDVPYGFQELWNYHQGADLIADFFDDVTGEDANKYALFQDAMGNIIIVRTTIRPSSSSGGNGYTGGQIIYDMFDELRKKYEEYIGVLPEPHPMTATNFAHELAHSFSASSGMGGWPKSPQYALVAALWPYLGDEDIVHENSLSNYVEGGVITDDIGTEILADFLLNMALGNISFEELPLNIQQTYLLAIANAITYHTTPEEMIAQLNTGGLDNPAVIQGKLNNPYSNRAISIRHQLNENGAVDLDTSFYDAMAIGTDAQIVGATPEPILDSSGEEHYWLYVATGSNGNFQYGWVRADLINVNGVSVENAIEDGTFDLDNLPQITPDQTYPQSSVD